MAVTVHPKRRSRAGSVSNAGSMASDSQRSSPDRNADSRARSYGSQGSSPYTSLGTAGMDFANPAATRMPTGPLPTMTIGGVAGSASGYAGTAANDDSEIFTLLIYLQLVCHKRDSDAADTGATQRRGLLGTAPRRCSKHARCTARMQLDACRCVALSSRHGGSDLARQDHRGSGDARTGFVCRIAGETRRRG